MLSLSASDDHQYDAAYDQQSTEHRWERDALSLRMFKLERTKLGVFFLCRPVYPAKCEADDASDDEDNADNAGWFHSFDPTKRAGLRSVG